MDHGIEIIDVGDDGGFEPQSPLPRNDRARDPYDDLPEIRPPMHQRMSSLSISDQKPNIKVRRDSSLDRDSFVYWRLEKEGEDWGSAYRRKVIAPQNEIEKMAKKGKGSVLSETTKMGGLRSQHLTRLVDDQNDGERGDERWEAVYIKSDKIRRRTGRIECKSMDVILARRKPSPKPAKKYRSSSAGELVDIITESKPKGDKKDKKKDKDDRSKSPKRDSFFDDPFSSQQLFHSSGAPMDDRGVIEFKNAGLPPDIPADRPIGYGARDEHDQDKKGGKKRGGSKEGDDELDEILDVIDLGETPSAAVDSLDAILGHDASRDAPHAEPGRRRSRSSRQPKGGRSRSRSRSRNRPESISFPPNFHTRQYMGDHGDSSSTTSNESRYGIDREERSSYTSQDTYPNIGRRGSYAEGATRSHSKVYKEHYPGPSGKQAKYHYHGDAKVYEEPADRRRRYSRRSFSQADRIPTTRQIGYNGYGGGDLVRRRDPPYDDPDPYYPPRRRRPSGPTTPILHYPSEMPDRRAERYMDESVRGDYLDRRERDLTERERRLDAAEQQREDDERRQEQYRREMEDEARYQDELDRRDYERRTRSDDGRRYYDDRYYRPSGNTYYD